jgi:hexosaminidase
MSALLFQGEAKVSAVQDAQMPGALRYTTDGTVPNGKSPVYKSPITVTSLKTVTFAYVTPAGKPGDVAKVDCRPAAAETVEDPKAGWKVAYYEGQWNKVPDFGKLQPALTGDLNLLGLTMAKRQEFFAIDAKGYFKAEESGTYTFGLSSDDGSWLKVGGATAVDNDGPHGNSEKTGSIWLPKGWHKIEVGYYQGTGAAVLTLRVKVPGATEYVSADSLVFNPTLN